MKGGPRPRKTDWPSWPSTLTLKDHDDDSAAHWAAYKDSIESLSTLCSFGVSPSEQDAFGSTSLHLAVQQRAWRSLHWLLEHDEAPRMFAMLDRKGRSPTALAADRGDAAVIELLAEYAECIENPDKAKSLHSRFIGAQLSLHTTSVFTWNYALDVTESTMRHANRLFVGGAQGGAGERGLAFDGSPRSPVVPMPPAIED